MIEKPSRLAAVDAVWADGPSVGGWISGRLAQFGPSVGHAVPLGHAAYAVVPIRAEDTLGPRGGTSDLGSVIAVLDVLARFTADQRVRFAIWEGWPFWYAAGSDPRIGPGVGLYWSD